MEGGHVIPEAIQSLLEKRGTFQDWLRRLDELGSDFRPEVAGKVRSDYESRLTEVEGELEGHRTELESALAERSEVVDSVAGRHDAHAAELEETELRHAVGEFDDEEWGRRRGEQQSKLDELQEELTTQRSAVESLQTVLSELTGAAAVAAAAQVETEPPIPEELVASEAAWPEPDAENQEPETVEVVETAERDPWMTQPLDDAASADVALAELVEPDVVETEFADAQFVEAEVVDEDAAGAEGAEEVEAEAEAPDTDAGEAEPDEFMDELEFLESLSLDDADNFDAVSAMLDEDEESESDGESKGKKEDS